MFGWFKRKSKPVMVSNNRYTFVRGNHVASIRVRASDHWEAQRIAALIDKAVRQKKKHSHLLAELKALEVKHEDA